MCALAADKTPYQQSRRSQHRQQSWHHSHHQRNSYNQRAYHNQSNCPNQDSWQSPCSHSSQRKRRNFRSAISGCPLLISAAASSLLLCVLLLSASRSHASLPVPLDLHSQPVASASRAWAVSPALAEPKGLRPCCAFGYNLHANLFGVPVPFYHINNIIQIGKLGNHRYNSNSFASILDLTGLGAERNGIVYTRHGGFIDTAHVRDSADMTLYIFSQLWQKSGQPFTLTLPDELARRQIVFSAFTPPADPAERYTLATYLAASLAFQLAAWHEIAQWYGMESFPGFSEGISAFSPEDLYSNLLGTRLAISLILSGHAANKGMYNATMDTLLREALNELDALPAAQTQQQFDRLNHLWWNNRCSLPDKFLLLKRNYSTADQRLPTALPDRQDQSLYYRLTLPHRLYQYDFASLAQLRLLPGRAMKNLPPPAVYQLDYYSVADFPLLVQHAQQQDSYSLQQLKKNQCRH